MKRLLGETTEVIEISGTEIAIHMKPSISLGMQAMQKEEECKFKRLAFGFEI